MAKRENENVTPVQEEEEQENAQIRHTISAEETFTLAKDVFDLRTFIVNTYNNRSVIARRLNIFSMIFSLIFTMIYTAYNVWSIIKGVSLGQEIAIYILIGIYAVLIVAFIIVVACSNRANTKTLKKYNKALKIFRFCIRAVSIAMAIASIVINAGSSSAASTALHIIMVIISVICIVIQAIPLIFGGVVKLVRWSMSPAKGKARFSKVLLEWYNQVSTGNSSAAAAKNVSKKFIEDIGICIDGYLIPQLGKRHINKITAAEVYGVCEAYTGDRNLLEGILKNVFGYAKECGYVLEDPTKDLGFEGSIEEEQKQPRKTIKGRIASWAGKKAKSALDGFLSGDNKK